MEEETQNGGAHARVLTNRPRHDWSDDRLQIRAASGIEERGELCIGGVC